MLFKTILKPVPSIQAQSYSGKNVEHEAGGLIFLKGFLIQKNPSRIDAFAALRHPKFQP